MIESLDVVEVAWTGPYRFEDIAGAGADSDRGLLAVYGSHPVFGADALLYIDEAREAPFAARLDRLRPWLLHLPTDATFYVGQLGGRDALGWPEWLDAIQRAYRLAVFFHSPPWNSQGVNHHGVEVPTVLLNVGRRHRLALEVSTLWDRSAYAPGAESALLSGWRPYAPEPPPAPAAEE